MTSLGEHADIAAESRKARAAQSDSARRSVLVRTLPIVEGNYGGILQAWSLQASLLDLGHDAIVDVSRSNQGHVAINRLKALARHSLLRVLPGDLLPSWYLEKHIRPFVIADTQAFVRSRIRTVRLYPRHQRIDAETLDKFDAFVVGSDQVWRYGDTASYLLDFLPSSFQGPRVAYAASFGSDSAADAWGAAQGRYSELAARFSAVSVREESGVALCRDYWGIEAIRVVDPTMLRSAREFRAMGTTPHQGPGLFASYILDKTPEAGRLLDRLRSEFGGGTVLDLHPAPTSYREYMRNPSKFRRPSVESWLGSMATASRIVTDSFHGTVFSILFNRPFLVLPNASRGLARFETLLKIFGLEERAILGDSGEEVVERMNAPIDWDRVNHALYAERTRAWEFLRRSLEDNAGGDGLTTRAMRWDPTV